MLAVTLLGSSIAGRELLIIGAVVVGFIFVGIVLMNRRPPQLPSRPHAANDRGLHLPWIAPQH